VVLEVNSDEALSMFGLLAFLVAVMSGRQPWSFVFELAANLSLVTWLETDTEKFHLQHL
jgi:hypothetical protein